MNTSQNEAPHEGAESGVTGMTARGSIAYSLGRDGAHREARPDREYGCNGVSVGGWVVPSQRGWAIALVLAQGKGRARRLRVGACMREDTAQGERRR